MSTEAISSVPLLDVASAAAYLGIGQTSLRAHLKQGTGPAYIPLGPNGGRVVFRQASLDQWLVDRERSGKRTQGKLTKVREKT